MKIPKMTEDQELAILMDCDWDGETAAYPIVQAWLERKLVEAILTVELQHGKFVTDNMREALEKAEWARDYVPGYGPKGKLETA
jgi:hypothetical protein